MSSIKNWCVRALPLASVLLGCGPVDAGDPSVALPVDEGGELELASTPAVSVGTPLSGATVTEELVPNLGSGPVGNPQCVPATPQTCAQAKSCESPPAPPPEIKLTGCTIQVTLETVTVESGQGATEGNMEMSVRATSGGDSLRWPSSGETPMAVDNTKHIEEVVTEYQLAPKEKRTIDICATFTEDDNQGINGKSDVGKDCETLEISCKLAKTGAVKVDVQAPLCKGDKRDEDGVCKNYNGEASARFEVAVSDQDWDNVPNDEDATPEPEDEACRGQEGRAVVLFLDFGSSDLNDLIGIVGMGVDDFVDGYDFVAIATDPLEVAGFTLREHTLANADMLVPPTLEGLLDALRVITSYGYDITFFDLGHGGATTSGDAYFTSAGPTGQIYESQLDWALAPENIGACALPLRAVNSLACYFGQMNEMWIAHGAKVSGGANAGEFFPQELNGFVRHWNNGDTFGASAAASFDPIVRNLNRVAVGAVGATYYPTMGCAKSVLGLNPCAQQFFTVSGPTSMSFANNGRYDYDPTLSGQDNMDASSADLIAGFPAIDKFTPLTW